MTGSRNCKMLMQKIIIEQGSSSLEFQSGKFQPGARKRFWIVRTEEYWNVTSGACGISITKVLKSRSEKLWELVKLELIVLLGDSMD